MESLWVEYTRLAEGLLLGADAVLGVWSTVDEDFVAATDAWIDNSWDVQRRRGFGPTLKYRGPA
jgi:hypothetical protein